MQNTEEPSTVPLPHVPLQHRSDRWLVQAVFFIGFWVYVWLLIKPRLIYDAFGIYLPYPEFAADGACLWQALSRPAGPVEYVSAFLSQWFCDPRLGALVVTATAGLICLGTDRLLRDMSVSRRCHPARLAATTEVGRALLPVADNPTGKSAGPTTCVHELPVETLNLLATFAVLILYQTYHHPLTALLALASCLWLAAAYQAVSRYASPTRKQGISPPLPSLARRAVVASIAAKALLAGLRPVLFVAICGGLYYLAGAVSVLFGLLVGTWHVCGKRRIVAGAGAVVASVLVPWLVGTTLSHMTVVEAYSVAWPFGPGSTSDMETRPLNVLRALFLFPLGMLLVVAIGRGPLRAVQDRLLRFGRRGGRILRVTAQLVALAGVVAVIHQFLPAPHREKRFEMVHFALQRHWDHVLRTAHQVPRSSYDCFVRHLVNRSLYHTGRLGDDLFSFPQDRAGLLLLTRDVPHGAPKFWMLSEIAWEMGDVNLAEQWAFERLEAVGECPEALELLALICLAKERFQPVGRPNKAVWTALEGRPTSAGREAARVLLRRMKTNVIQGRRAETLLGLLDGRSSADEHWLAQVERVRALRCTDDRVFQDYSEELMLEGLLRANPRNRMAFEYLMAFYLIGRRTDKLVENLPRLDEFGYREIPRHFEEALLIHANDTGQHVDLRGRKMRPETVQRFRAFIDRVRPWQNQPHLAAGALADEFGDSYFYYYAFGISGTGRAKPSSGSQGPLADASGYDRQGTGGTP